MNNANLQQLFQMMNYNPISRPIKTTKIQIASQSIVDQNELNNFSVQIRSIYDEIFCDQQDNEEKNKQIKLQNKIRFQIRQTSMPVCNKILDRSEPVFRCYDCMTHQASVICKPCFENANHKGHRYSQISSGGGNCDCGNPDAIKQIGFCKDHPGKADPVIIDEKQQQHFLQISLTILEWLFRLYQSEQSKGFIVLGQLFSTYLFKLNQSSLFYNTLTYKLLYSKRLYARQNKYKAQKIINKIFQYGIKHDKFSQKMTNVFLNMFSLQIFKYQLTVSYTQAYNKYPKFQLSKYKSLYIQLFANNDILMKVLEEKQLVLFPYQKQYDYGEYIQNLMFLSSIKPDVASKFFQLLMQKSIIKLPELDLIQARVQKGNEHLIQVTNQHLNFQNYYYSLMQNILTSVQKKPQSLINMFRNYSSIIMSKEYSYQKNKMVMPFHKILAMIFMAIYKGNISDINTQEINKLLQHESMEGFSLNNMTERIFELILLCFREFSTTFFESSYFENYTPLYVKSGNTIVVFDMLMMTICIEIFKKTQNQKSMNQILQNIFKLQMLQQKKQQHQKQSEQIIKQSKQIKNQNPNSINDQEDWSDDQSQHYNQHFELANFIINQKLNPTKKCADVEKFKILRQITQMMKILIETCISSRSQVLISTSLKISSPQSQQKAEQLFVETMNNFKEITLDNLKSIQKNFFQSKLFQNQLIRKFLTYDKFKKKYTLNQINHQKYSDKKLPLHLHQTLKKVGGIFNIEQKKEDQNQLENNINLEREKIQRLKFLFNQQILKRLSSIFISQTIHQNNLEDKDLKNIFFDFFEVMRILQSLLKEQSPIAVSQFFTSVQKLSQNPSLSYLNQKLQGNNVHKDKEEQKSILMKKFADKKKKRLQQMKSKQKKYQEMTMQAEKQQENQSTCIICRQNDKKQGLCFLASFNYSNLLQVINKSQGRSLLFSSCFHPIHIKCFRKTSRDSAGYIPCPLCKSQSNIILPFEKQISNSSVIQQVVERIIILKAELKQSYKGFDKDFQENSILSFLKSLTSMIGKNLIRNQPILNHKSQRLSNILYELCQKALKTVLKPKEQQSELNGIEKYLQKLEQKITENNSEEVLATNFYAVEYLTLKILYYCLKGKFTQCQQILNQKIANLINEQDLRKIWQMCNQIAALPNFKQKQYAQQNKQNIKQMRTKINFYSPPQTVYQLIQIRDRPEMSCKNGHTMCICLICQKKGCLDCKEMTNHIQTRHCGQCVSFNLLTGGLMFMYDNKISVQIPSFYNNQMGVEWRPSKIAEGFVLDNQLYQELKTQILSESVLKFLMQKFPDILKKGILQDLFQF